MTEQRPDGYLSPQSPPESATAAPGQIEQGPQKKTGTGVKAAIAGLAVLALGGGLAIADPLDMRKDNASAKGAAAVLPADVLGFSEVNFNPELSQKAEMVRFAMKFPGLKSKINLTEDGDLKQELWQSMSKDSTCLKGVNYDADIKPWLGDRMGVAVRPGAKTPVIAIEATDEAKARAGYEKLNACDKGNDKLTGLAYIDGYLVAAKTQADADKAIVDAKAGALKDRAEFKEDFEKLGTQGILSLWGSKEGLVEISKQSSVDDELASKSPASADVQKQIEETPLRSAAATLRFSDGNPEFLLMGKSTKDISAEGTTAVGNLPGDTAVAIGIADGAKQLDKNWDQVKKSIEDQGTQVSDIESRLKLKLPDDLKTLLGKDLRISVGKFDPDAVQGPADLPIAIAMDTEKAKVEDIVTRTGLGAQGLQVSGEDTAPVVGISTDWANQVSQPSSKLSDDAAFKAAVASPDKAQSVVYFNLDAFKDAITKNMSSSEMENVEPLQAVGVSSRIEADNYSAVQMRVTAK